MHRIWTLEYNVAGCMHEMFYHKGKRSARVQEEDPVNGESDGDILKLTNPTAVGRA